MNTRVRIAWIGVACCLVLTGTRIAASPPAAQATTAAPVRIATFAMTNGADGRVRILLTAEIGAATTIPTRWNVKLSVGNSSGAGLSNSGGQLTLLPSRPGVPSPALFSTPLLLDPGDYTVKLTAVGDGGVGSGEHRLTARLHMAGGFEVSDLVVVAVPPKDDSLQLTPSAIIDGGRVVAIIELQHDDLDKLAQARARFAVAQSSDGPSIVTSEASSGAGPTAVQRVFSSTLSVDVLPPGDYFMRAAIVAPGVGPAPIVRPFRIERPVTATAVTRSATSASVSAAMLPKLVAAIPPFGLAQAIDAEVVRPFLDDLERRNASAKDPFMSGLAALKDDKPAQAATFFQQTLRSAPDFVGVAFFLGACHAAGGRDREAIGAWQMSLLTPGASAAYPLLVDALLRVGETKRAIEFLEEAPEAWRNVRARLRRQGVARAMAGDNASALPVLAALIGDQPEDRDLLFVGLHVLYALHLDPGLDASDRTRFVEWADRYEKLQGGEQPLVRAWRDHVNK